MEYLQIVLKIFKFSGWRFWYKDKLYRCKTRIIKTIYKTYLQNQDPISIGKEIINSKSDPLLELGRLLQVKAIVD